jgi:hypothetical protein
MTRCHHCVVTLTGSQLGSKVRALLPDHQPNVRKDSQCARGHASSSVPDVRNQPTRVFGVEEFVTFPPTASTWPATSTPSFRTTRKSDGRRAENKIPIGLARELPDKRSAWAEVERLHLPINPVDSRRGVTFGDLVLHYAEHELVERSE